MGQRRVVEVAVVVGVGAVMVVVVEVGRGGSAEVTAETRDAAHYGSWRLPSLMKHTEQR